MPSKKTNTLPYDVPLPPINVCDIAQVLGQVKITIPLVELIRIPEHQQRALAYLSFCDDNFPSPLLVSTQQVGEKEEMEAHIETEEILEVYLGTTFVES